jgi:tetratricopeptide (TPR) repeat protein
MQGVAELPVVFRRSVVLPQAPASASLSLRACRGHAVSINGQSVPLPTPDGNWKEPQTVDVSLRLRSGTNSLSVTVWNRVGPPALWLVVTGRDFVVKTDESWEASYAGSVWQPARLATRPPLVRPGNPCFGGERSFAALERRWKFVVVLGLLAVGLTFGGRWWCKRAAAHQLPSRWRWAAEPSALLLAGIVVVWAFLFTYDLSFMPRSLGFDADGHLDYIQYIQAHRALPLADQGWEMHQPPLYYLLSAAVLDCFRLPAHSFDGLAMLRLLSLAIGLAHVALVFFSLRVLFPGETSKQTAGLTLAGFLPMQLYLTNYVTNETLAACLMSATLLFILKLLRAEQPDFRLYAAAGLSLGLALLTKVTAVVLAPFAVAALVYCALRGSAVPGSLAARRGHRVLLLLVGLGSCLAVCGWHYFLVWRHFGNPLFVQTRWGFGVGWWQDPGYRTAAYFGQFGRSLTEPLFSGLFGFADGLYSTLWGDGLCGGAATLAFRPPWDYDLMSVGFLLALATSGLILLGLAVTAVKLVRRLEPCWLLLLSFGFALVLAVIHLNLAVPGYGEVKAFYGLGALVPLCALAAAGWGLLARGSGMLRVAGAVVLAIWALTSYATYWVKGDAAATQAAVGRGLWYAGNHASAAAHLTAALETDPHYAQAGIYLVDSLLEQGRVPEADALARRVVNEHPKDAQCHLALAAVLEKQGQSPAAVESTRRAVELALDSPEARLKLASRLFQLGRSAEAITACREALRLLPTDPEVHVILAEALAGQAKQPGASLSLSGNEPLPFSIPNASPGDILTAEAMNHLRWALQLAPHSPEVLQNLAWLLATHPRAEFRNGKEAVSLAERACALTGHEDASMLCTLAAAQAEAGDFRLAVQTAEKGEKLAEAAGLIELHNNTQRMLECFQSERPFHQEVPR